MKKVLKGFALTILVIVLFLSTTALLFLVSFKNTFSKNTMKNIVSNIQIEQIVEENPEVKEEIHEAFKPIYEETEKYGIDEDVIIKIMDSKEVKNFLGNITGNIVDYAITGENHKLIMTEDIEELVSGAIDSINNTGYVEISPKEKEDILKVVRDQAQEYQEAIPDTSVFENQLSVEDKESLNQVRFLLGNELMIYIIVAMVLSILGILALKWKNAKWIKWTAITVLASSILGSLITGILYLANDILLKEDIPYVFDIVNKILNLNIILQISIVVAMIVILIIYSYVYKRKAKQFQEPKLATD